MKDSKKERAEASLGGKRSKKEGLKERGKIENEIMLER